MLTNLAEYSERDLNQLVGAASDASFFVWQAHTAWETYIESLYPTVITDYKSWFVGSNELSAILTSYNHWKSDVIARWPTWAQAPSWFFPYRWFHDDSFRVYGSRFKKLNEMSKKILEKYSWMQTSLNSSALTDYNSIYRQFSSENPAEPGKSGLGKAADDIADRFKELWDSISPILKWGAIGLAAIIALGGTTKKKE